VGLDPGLGERGPDRVAVVDDEAEVASLVGTLAAALGHGQELVAEVEEGHAAHAAAQLEGEQPPVEVERGVEVCDLERDVVDADQTSRAHISGILADGLSLRRQESYVCRDSSAVRH
jgi:hypothetical protein